MTLVVIGHEWRHLFNDPAFRLGWTDARLGVAPRPDYEGRIFYTHGRQMALEARGYPLPQLNEQMLTPAMHAIVVRCISFVDMMVQSERSKEQAAKERAELVERLEKAEADRKAAIEARQAALRRVG